MLHAALHEALVIFMRRREVRICVSASVSAYVYLFLRTCSPWKAEWKANVCLFHRITEQDVGSCALRAESTGSR